MPVYNAERYVASAVKSILTQSFQDFEFIIVDDGSTDRSQQILQGLARKDGRIRLISRPNTGIAGALNDGLAIARGDSIARMDADDLADGMRIQRQMDYMMANADCVALGTGAWIMDRGGRVVDRYVPPASHGEILEALLKGNGGALLHPSVMFRRAVLQRAGGYDPGFCKAEDLDIYLRISEVGHFANLPEPLLRYRHHFGSTNFVHRERQRRLIGEILGRERSRRGLPALDVPGIGHSDLPAAALHRYWACTSRKHGTFRTALKHAFAAVFLEPGNRASWRTLRYVTSFPSAGTQ